MLFSISLVSLVCGEIVNLPYGSFLGVEKETPVPEFKTVVWHSIPYATQQRFKAPGPPKDTKGGPINDATVPGVSCMIDTTKLMNTGATTSEDCLNLNGTFILIF
jgi:carboxylesterase type B